MKTTDNTLEQLLSLLQNSKTENSQELLAKTLPHFAAILAILHGELKTTNRRLLWLNVVVIVLAFVTIAPRLLQLLYFGIAAWQ